MKFSKEQPMDGENILHCGHEGQLHHWWKFPSEAYFRRPDGTVGTAVWIVACDECHKNCGGDGSKLEIRGDGVWTGNDPVIKSNE